MKKYIHKIMTGLVITGILILAFWFGGNVSGGYGSTEETKAEKDIVRENAAVSDGLSVVEEEISSSTEGDGASSKQAPEEKDMAFDDVATDTEFDVSVRDTDKDKCLTDLVTEDNPVPAEPGDEALAEEEYTCTLSVRCDTIINNISRLDKEKVELVPKDGVIFAEKTVTFCRGESVFNLLLREMKQNGIHMEFEDTPIYNSAYIEGIGNLYEFDCGELSGWMYKVNDRFPDYGCSRYQLKAGDKVEWVYTCDLGADVGGYYATRGE